MTPIALTMGEPAGIGGELTLAAFHALKGSDIPLVVLDDPERIATLAGAMNLPTPLAIVDTPEEALSVGDRLAVLPLPQTVPLRLGTLDPATAPAVLWAIERAVDLATEGRVRAVVTNPIHKGVLLKAGFQHAGHTEFLAELAGVPRTVMMLAAPELRVVPVTIHIPLSTVPATLTTEAIVETGRIVADALAFDFGVPKPRIAVTGLNPHAGEDGLIGTEDRDVIAPAVAALKADGINAFGPLSGDTLFHPRARATFDAALCMYHDQALIPIKTIAIDDGVNVTLGLPFVRTSPDHGTAIDIAGKGVARPDSLIAAIRLAAQTSHRRTRVSTVAAPT